MDETCCTLEGFFGGGGAVNPSDDSVLCDVSGTVESCIYKKWKIFDFTFFYLVQIINMNIKKKQIIRIIYFCNIIY